MDMIELGFAVASGSVELIINPPEQIPFRIHINAGYDANRSNQPMPLYGRRTRAICWEKSLSSTVSLKSR
jgi:regulator of extracellular matrix RemA (YlzA/DUF370 family)